MTSDLASVLLFYHRLDGMGRGEREKTTDDSQQ